LPSQGSKQVRPSFEGLQSATAEVAARHGKHMLPSAEKNTEMNQQASHMEGHHENNRSLKETLEPE
jgi:hypothetical protein